MLEGRFPRVRSALAAGLVARDPGFVDARRRLATVLVADAVGYTARMETNARAALTALFECRNLIAEAVEGAGGTVVDTPGDFFLSLMPTVPVAVACAVAIQRELGERNRNCEEDYRAVYRIGIGLGDLYQHGDDVLGEAINIAARLQALAQPGGIVLSGPARDVVGEQTDLAFDYLGERPLKNLTARVRAYAVASRSPDGGPARPIGEPRAGPGDAMPIRPIVEVEDFKAATGSEFETLFAAGLVEEIIGILAILSGSLTVRQVGSATRPVQLAAGHAETPRIYRLSGTVRRGGDATRILARLTASATGEAVWADRFSYGLEESFDAQELIAHEVVTAIQGTLTEGQQIAIWRKSTSSLRAWELFQRGHDLEQRFTRESHKEARRCYQSAVTIDPNYASAIIALAFCHLDEIRLGWSPDAASSFEAAGALYERAIAVEPEDPGCHALLAFLELHQARDEAAAAAMHRAVALAPGSGELFGYLGYLCETLGRWEEALAAYRRAMRLSTHFPAWIASNFGFAMCNVGQLHEARRAFLGVTANHPDYVRAYIGLVVTYRRLGMADEAGHAVTELLRRDPLFTVADWAAHRPYADAAIVEAFARDMREAGLA